MLKGSTNDNYKISPIKKEIKEFYIELYKLGITNYIKLKEDTKKYTELLQLFNKLNEERQKRGQKPKTLNEKQFASQYRQYIHMSGLYQPKEDKKNKQKFKSYIRRVKNEEIREETKKLEVKRDIAKEELKEAQQQMVEITQDNLSYINAWKQQEEFVAQDFYKKQTQVLIQATECANDCLNIIRNKIAELKTQDLSEQNSRKIELLTRNYDKISNSIIGIANASKNITTVPTQAINFLLKNIVSVEDGKRNERQETMSLQDILASTPLVNPEENKE